jgi:hypothetical protein
MANNLTNLTPKEISKKLQDIANKENSESFTVDVIFSGPKEISVPNKLTFVPSRYIIASQSGPGSIIRGSKQWTKTSLSLKLDSGQYKLKKTFEDINGTKVLTDVDIVPSTNVNITAKITFLK